MAISLAQKGLTRRQPNGYNSEIERNFAPNQQGLFMIDNFSILLSHGLLLFMFWLLINRQDLNSEAPPTPDVEPEGFAIKHARPAPAVKSDTAADTDNA